MEGNELTAAEAAYFDSRGASDIPTETVETTPEPVSTPEPTTPDPIPNADGQARDEKGKFVPHGAFHEERSKRQALERDLTEMRSKQAVLEDRWNTLLKLREQQQEQPVAPPSMEEDVFAYLKHQDAQVKALQSKIDGREKADTEARQAQAQEQAIWQHWQESANKYSAENAEFGEAAQWLSDYRMKQLEALGVVDARMSNPDNRNAQINAELKSIIIAAHQQQRNPAELVHELAKGYGFKAQPQQETKPAPDPMADLANKVDKLGKAIDQSKTLTASGGKASADPTSAEAILTMSNAEFTQWVKDPANERRFNQILAGRA